MAISHTLYEDDQAVEKSKFLLEEWFPALLPDNYFLIQKECMTIRMKKPIIMKVKDFGNNLKT